MTGSSVMSSSPQTEPGTDEFDTYVLSDIPEDRQDMTSGGLDPVPHISEKSFTATVMSAFFST
jgi:hypothetical protein